MGRVSVSAISVYKTLLPCHIMLASYCIKHTVTFLFVKKHFLLIVSALNSAGPSAVVLQLTNQVFLWHYITNEHSLFSSQDQAAPGV